MIDDDDPSFVTVIRDSEGARERVGSIDATVVPAAGDILVLGYPGDSGSGPYEVLRREYVNGYWYAIVRDIDLASSAAADHVRGLM